jgi:hypothetical protein
MPDERSNGLARCERGVDAHLTADFAGFVNVRKV